MAQRRLLVYLDLPIGGISDYTRMLCLALQECHSDIIFLLPEGYKTDGLPYDKVIKRKLALCVEKKSGLIGKIQYACRLVKDWHGLAEMIRKHKPDAVLIASFSEYLSPMWAGALRKLNREGVRFGSIIHDPIRDFQLGPLWFHRLSVRQAYQHLDIAYVHGDITPETCGCTDSPEVHEIWQGVYPLARPDLSRVQLMESLDLKEPCRILLSFGHIRDGKNVDLAIRALGEHPELHLVVAGPAPSSSNKPVRYYEELAVELGVADRCHFLVGFMPDERASAWINAADVILLTYSSQFHSASSALNYVAEARPVVLASSGDGPLKTAMNTYCLGKWVKPDDSEDLKKELGRAVKMSRESLEWDKFMSAHSWERSARVIIKTLLR